MDFFPESSYKWYQVQFEGTLLVYTKYYFLYGLSLHINLSNLLYTLTFIYFFVLKPLILNDRNRIEYNKEQ